MKKNARLMIRLVTMLSIVQKSMEVLDLVFLGFQVLRISLKMLIFLTCLDRRWAGMMSSSLLNCLSWMLFRGAAKLLHSKLSYLAVLVVEAVFPLGQDLKPVGAAKDLAWCSSKLVFSQYRLPVHNVEDLGKLYRVSARHVREAVW
nr:hypothetical protein Iba_chr12bCG3650 [Ipomoea batatas]